MERYFTDILNYCKDNIERFEKRFNTAFCLHFEQHIPLYLADERLATAIQDSIDEWCDLEEVDADLIDVEEFLIWCEDYI